MKKQLRDRILKSIERAKARGYSGPKLVTAVAKNMSVSAADVRTILEEAGEDPASTVSAPPPRNRKRSRLGTVSVDELIEKERLDAFRIAKDALTNDLGEDETIPDEALRQHCGISKEEWKEIRTDERLSKWRVHIRRSRKVVWCGAKARRKLEELDTVIVD